MPVWVDGELLEPGAPAISAEDPGFLLGTAVFDTLLCEGGRIFFVGDHLERLSKGAAGIGIVPPAAEVIRSALVQVATVLGTQTAAIRITLTPGAPGQGVRLVLTTRPWRPLPKEGVTLLRETRAKVSGHDLEGLKTTSRARNVLARQRAQERGAWDALLGTDQGDFCEGTVSNIFIVIDGQLRTPPLESGCLPGIVRGKVMALAAGLGSCCAEERVELEDLVRAEEIFMTSSLARITPVTGILDLRDDLPVGGGLRTRELQRGLTELEGFPGGGTSSCDFLGK